MQCRQMKGNPNQNSAWGEEGMIEPKYYNCEIRKKKSTSKRENQRKKKEQETKYWNKNLLCCCCLRCPLIEIFLLSALSFSDTKIQTADHILIAPIKSKYQLLITYSLEFLYLYLSYILNVRLIQWFTSYWSVDSSKIRSNPNILRRF